jgi:hypothetical protein
MAFEPSRLASYDRESILAEIKRVVKLFFPDKCPKHGEFNRFSRVHSSTVVREFGSWEAAMRASGLEYARSPLDRKALVADLRAVLHRAGGRYFTQDFYERNGGLHSVKTIKARFGNGEWAQVLEQVLGVGKVRRVIVRKPRPSLPSRTDLLKELARVWNEVKGRPTKEDFKRRSKVHTHVVEDQFGGWTKACDLLASQDKSLSPLVTGSGRRCSDDMLLAELHSVVAKTSGKILLYRQYRDLGGTYSIHAFQKHFGGWESALQRIGLKGGHKEATNEELFSEIQRVWEILGRQPKASEMRQQQTKMRGVDVITQRFGGWHQAIHAFCRDRNSTSSEQEAIMPIPEQPQSSGEQKTKPSLGIGCQKQQLKPNEVTILKTTPRLPGPRLRFKVLERDHFTCRACGRSPATMIGLVLHVDHIIPYSGNGETVLDNLQTLCSQCNLGKSDSTAAT